MVDRTTHADEASAPKLNLRQIFGHQDLPTAKETISKLWEGDLTPLGADAAAQELSVMKTMRSSTNDLFEFIQTMSSDFLIHGFVPYYEPAETRTRSDVIIVKSGLSRSAEDLLSISKADQRDGDGR
eukprot:s6628_g8.t1